MIKSINISIPEPCHEDWSKMTPKEKGRFCDSCEKVVVDMTKLTDHEIFHLVDTGKKICGRFRNDQLNRPIMARVPFKRKKSHWAIAASLLIGLSLLASCDEEPVVGELEAIEQKESKDTSSCGEGFNKDEIMIDSGGNYVLTDSAVADVNDDTANIIISGNLITEPPIPNPIQGGIEIKEPVPPIIENDIHYLGQPIVHDSKDSTTKK